eukprot:scaffold125816_cov20-Tisochrysis_lutea.AAC.4
MLRPGQPNSMQVWLSNASLGSRIGFDGSDMTWCQQSISYSRAPITPEDIQAQQETMMALQALYKAAGVGVCVSVRRCARQQALQALYKATGGGHCRRCTRQQ